MLIILFLFLLLTLVGCSNHQGQNVSLEIWHYYNGVHKIMFDEMIADFNETIGLDKGIMVEAFSQGNISQLEEKVIESVNRKVGPSAVPNMVTIYPEIAYSLDKLGIVTDLEDYITAQELDQYIDSYIEEGRLGEDEKFKIFPIAKSTEVMMVNKTDWDQFAKATDASPQDLTSWEGVARTGELYYHWTDSLTEEENDGKAFFGRDAMANYMLVGAKQLEKEIFQVNEEDVVINLDRASMRKLWDYYYIPYISGYYTSYGRFSTDDAKTGEIIALVGSTAAAPYFPENVTIGDNEPYDIELLVLPLPNFENTGPSAVQQGAGMAVLKSDRAQEEASVEFLKWFTQEERDLDFSIETGYLPVKKEAYDQEVFGPFFEEKSKQGLSKQLQLTMPLAMEQVITYDLNITKAFKEGGKCRKILELSLQDPAKSDRKKVIKLIEDGLTHEEAVQYFSADENFEAWLLELQESLRGAVGK